jgi:hypothetical protein
MALGRYLRVDFRLISLIKPNWTIEARNAEMGIEIKFMLR